MSSRRCSFPAATSARWRCMARSTISPWPARGRCYLSASFILEEGFPLADLQRIAQSMGAAAREAGVKIVTGDTKVVERGKADGVFISTAGIGVVPDGLHLSGDRARPGDVDPGFRLDRRSWRGDHVEPREPAIRHADPVRFRRAARPGRGHGRRLRRGFAADARSDARRAGGDAERDRPSVRRRHPHRGGRPAGQEGGRGGLRTARPRSALCRQRRQAGRLRRGGGGGDAARRRCAAIRSAARPRSSAMSSATTIVSCRWRRVSAASASSTGCPANNCRAFVEGKGNESVRRRPHRR